MWLITTRGFYSAVEHTDDPDRLLVRARCRADLDNLSDLVPGEPVFLEDADYPWRVETTRAVWRAALAALADEVTYPNFKSAVPEPVHHDAYLRVWGALKSLEALDGPRA